MPRRLLIAGAGIGGLAAALAAARAGWQVQLLEQAPVFSEVGAGLQLGPNATRVLRDWGVLDAVSEAACRPLRLVARDARHGGQLAALPLGADFERLYGAPYFTVHRADLHTALVNAVRDAQVDLQAGQRIESLGGPAEWAAQADAVVGADGLWSAVRAALVADGAPRASDHAAYRALVPMADLPSALRAQEVTAWLGPRLHVVTYPVQGGRALNVVCVVQQPSQGERSGWDLPGAASSLVEALGPVCAPLQALVQAVPAWGRWVLHDRDPVGGPHEMAQGRVALLGDAAHPMRPYLAQGAGMAIEDAHALGQCLRSVAAGDQGMSPGEVSDALARYAQARWQRVARVQRRSLRNATIFHAAGPVRLARDLALRGLGARLMDLPWLYGHTP